MNDLIALRFKAMFNVHRGADTCACVAGESGKNEDKYKE